VMVQNCFMIAFWFVSREYPMTTPRCPLSIEHQSIQYNNLSDRRGRFESYAGSLRSW
jgi:hypothetical protein